MTGRVGPVETLASGEVQRYALGRLVVATSGSGFTDVTAAAASFIRDSGIEAGLLTLFCRHTSASLTVQENADPEVQRDLLGALDRLAPRAHPYFHHAEGPDDMPAHIRAMLTGSSLAVPVLSGRPALGTWQGLYLVEHRDRPHRRELLLHVAGS